MAEPLGTLFRESFCREFIKRLCCLLVNKALLSKKEMLRIRVMKLRFMHFYYCHDAFLFFLRSQKSSLPCFSSTRLFPQLKNADDLPMTCNQIFGLSTLDETNMWDFNNMIFQKKK